MISVEDQVDNLLGNNNNNNININNSQKGLSGFLKQFMFGFLIGLLIVTLSVIPIFGGRNGLDVLQSFFESNGSVDVVSVSDESNDTAAYHYWYAPENSFGIQEMKTVNWSYFWQLFKQHSAWQLEGQHPQTGEWLSEWDGQNLNEWLNITRIRNDDNLSEKINLNVTNNAPVPIKFRFTFGIDLRVKQYVNRSGQYEYTLTYPANATENYTVSFNWSDVVPMVDNGHISLKHGVKNVDDVDVFWFRIIGNQNLGVGKSFEIDPNFGYEGGYTASWNVENLIRGTEYMMGATGGSADNITTRLKTTTSPKTFKCAIYNNATSALVAYTEEKLIPKTYYDIWTLFNITWGGTLEANTLYWLVTWCNISAGVGEINIDSEAGYNVWGDSETYNGFPATCSKFLSLNNYRACIYCSYTESVAETWQVIDSTINGSYFNETITFQVIDITINGSYYNATVFQIIDSTINGSYSNTTTFQVIDATINGSYSNTTAFYIIDNTINGSYSNTTAFYIIDNTINGSYYNETEVWQFIDITINGSYSNTTAFQVIDDTINGSYINTTAFQVIDITINGSYINTTAFQVIDITINGSYYNETITWQTIDTTINGSYSNTSIPWNVIDITINGSYTNTSIVVLSLTNEYPTNNSNIFSVQPTLYFMLVGPVGGMSYKLYIGNTNITTNYLLDSDTGLDNGTYFYVNFYNASDYGTSYWWRVHYNDSSTHVNETFNFHIVLTGGGMGAGGTVAGIVGVIGLFGLLGFFWNHRRKQNNKYRQNNNNYNYRY